MYVSVFSLFSQSEGAGRAQWACARKTAFLRVPFAGRRPLARQHRPGAVEPGRREPSFRGDAKRGHKPLKSLEADAKFALKRR